MSSLMKNCLRCFGLEYDSDGDHDDAIDTPSSSFPHTLTESAMVCLVHTCSLYLCDPCLGFHPGKVRDRDEASYGLVEDLLWSCDLGAHSAGEFSHAYIQANAKNEDHSLVQIADGSIFVGVYDGHGGDAASLFVHNELFPRFNRIAKERHTIDENVLKEAFAETEREFLNLVRREGSQNSDLKAVGTCCLVGVIWKGTLYVANAGDSRLVIGKKCPTGGIQAQQLTEDDNCSRVAVREELRAAHPTDHSIVSLARGAWRVRGLLQVCRAIGDAFLKDEEFAFPRGHTLYLHPPLRRPSVSAIPNVHVRRLEANDQFLIFASDGLWDMISNTSAINIVRNNPRHGIAKRLIHEALKEAAKKAELPLVELRNVARRRYIHDDISVVVVYLDPQGTDQAWRGGPEPGKFDVDGID